MDAESARQLFVSYIDGQLDPDTVAEIDQCLEKDPVLRRELSQLRDLTGMLADGEMLETDAAMRARFDTFLRNQQPQARARESFLTFGWLLSFPPALRAAAAVAMIMVGAYVAWVFGGRSLASRQDGEVPIEDSFVYGPTDGLASGRIQWISQAGGVAGVEPEFRDALLEILANDPNGAVRIAAVKALAGFDDDPVVRRQLIAMLPEETDPMMQLALIEILSRTGTPEARDSIENLLSRRDVRGFVKGQAQLGLTYH